MRWLKRIAERTSWAWDDVLIRSLGAPSLLAIVSSGLVLMTRILPLSPEWDRAADIMLAAVFVLALILFVDQATSGVLDRVATTHPALRGARGLVQGFVRGLFIAIGLLIFLDSIGISIAPILASLGIGSLAVALALQETLANLFAGLYLVADKPVEQGQFIRLQSGEEGHVMRVGWRTTWIQTPQKTMVVVPNAKLAGSVLTNFDLPSGDVAFTVEVTVAMQKDLKEIERVTMETARAVQASTPGATQDFEPVFRYLGFGESGMRLNVGLSARTLADTHIVRHHFLVALTDRYRREGILIPFPTRTIDLPRGADLAGAFGATDAGARAQGRETRA